MKLTRTFEFDAAHRLPWHDGKCRRLHGHTYTVDVTVEGRVHDFDPDVHVGLRHGPPEAAMVVDFKTIDLIAKRLFVEPWDHRTLLYEADPLVEAITGSIDPAGRDSVFTMPSPPTAEYIALVIGTSMDDALFPLNVRCVRVDVHESPRSIATWERDA